jgi:DNA-binding MarR family transcriptional regulator
MGSPDSAAAFDALRRIIRFLRLADREAEATYGLTAAQLFVVHALADSPARSLAELAERTLTDQSSVSIVVSRLEAKKLIARTPSKDDRRRVELSLTTAGKKITTGSTVPQPRMIAALEAMPKAKRRQLVESLEALVAALGASELEPLMLFEDEPKKR